MLSLLLACAPSHPAPPERPPFRFAVLGDRTDEPNDDAWRRVVGEVKARAPDLVLTVGDLADDPYNPEEWTRALRGLSILTVPVAFTPGNHDIVDAASAAIFTARTGQAPWRSFDAGGSHFVILDNSIAESWEVLPEAQRSWLATDLATTAGRPTFVFMHKPFWALGVGSGKPDPMHELFVERGVTAVFTGHWHAHLHAQFDGVQYVGVGSSGGAVTGLPTVREGNVPEFVEATVRATGLSLETVIRGEAYPVDIVTLANRAVLRKLRQGAITARLDGDGIDVHVENLAAEPLIGTLRIDGGAWRTDPAIPIHAAPGETFTAHVAASAGSTLAPLPTFSLEYPLPDGGPLTYAFVVDYARELTAPTAAAPVVDGVLGTDEWAAAATVDQFVTASGEPATGDPTVVRVLRSADALYFAARCSDHVPADLTRIHPASERDGQVVYDDRVGVMLAPTPEQFYWFYVNPNGAVWDLHADKAVHALHMEWDAVEARATVDGSGWSVEARIPFAALGVSEPSGRWAFDIRRRNNREQSEALFTPGFASNQPARLGVLRFE